MQNTTIEIEILNSIMLKAEVGELRGYNFFNEPPTEFINSIRKFTSESLEPLI